MKERIIEMLGRGIPAVAVAGAVGCDESYVSQLLSEPGVADQVAGLRMASFERFAEHDDSIDAAEKTALTRLASLSAFITKPSEAAAVFKILNAAKRRTNESAVSSAHQPSTIVSLNLPEAARVQFTVSHNREVIEIAGRSLATLPSKSLVARLEQQQAFRLLATDVPATLLSKQI